MFRFRFSRRQIYSAAVAVSIFLSLMMSYNRVDRRVKRKSDYITPDRLLIRGAVTEVPVVSEVPLVAQYPDRRKPVIAPWTKLISHDGQKRPRSFVFSEITRLDDYGLKVRKYDEEQRNWLRDQVQGRLCARSKKFASSKYEANKCTQRMELMKCMSCSELDGTWYSASSITGAVFSKVEDGASIQYPNYNDGPYVYQQLDIAVPISGQDMKLRKFARHLGPSIKKFREGLQGSRIAIRLLITRFAGEKFESDEAMEVFQKELTKSTELERPGDSVEFVFVNELVFNRAKAINALHAVACHSNECVLACTDVDMNISSQFLRNALIYAFPGASAYFPIMWSEFNPETVELADHFLTESAKWKFTDHHGYWRKSSYGMYVISGADAKYLNMDEKFVGWGGEDNDFYARVGDALNIIRLHEKGLTHIWHPKDCKLGSFVENTFFKNCIGAKAHTEGSQLGLYLRTLRNEDPETYEAVMQVKSTDVESMANAIEETADDADVETVSVMIAVITSRENLKTRAATIMKTWGEPSLLPEGITMKFFVGAVAEGDAYSGSEADVESLAKEAGIRDLSMIHVMSNVLDDEYPPVRKNSAMIRHLDDLVSKYENDAFAASTFQWIHKVDDDTYVNLEGLLRFVKKRNPVGFHVYGERGEGRPEDKEGLINGGLVKPYCTGGPGYVFSRPTLKRAAVGMEECVTNADTSPYRDYLWHSDVVIGMCVQKQTGAGCWSDDDYETKRVFRNNFRKEYPFIEDSKLEWMVAMHPFKEAHLMEQQHQRYMALKEKVTEKV